MALHSVLKKQNPESPRNAAAEKAFVAERRIAYVRLAVVAYATLVYSFFMNKSGTVEWLVYLVLATAWVYSVGVLWLKPYQRFPLLPSVYLVSVTDAIIIFLWLYAAGGFNAPFYLAMYFGITAVAFRFSFREAIAAAFIYGLGYILLLGWMEQIVTNLSDVVLRIIYVFLVGALGGLLGKEALDQTKAKMDVQAVAENLASEIQTRKRVEAQLRLHENQQQVVLNNIPAPVLLVNHGMKILLCNAAYAEIAGRTVEELQGKNLLELDPNFKHTSLYATFRRVLDVVHAQEDEGKYGDRYFKTRVYRIPWGIVSISEDVTERRKAGEDLDKAEEKYRGIFENAAEGIFQSTSEGRYLMANPALARIYGYASPQELMSMVTDIQHQLFVDPKRREELKAVLDAHGQVSNFECEIYRKDATKRWISLNARLAQDAAGTAAFYEGFVEDITDRKQNEQTLKLVSEQQRASSRRLVETQENERRSLAADLHDTVVQWLSGTLFQIGAIKKMQKQKKSVGNELTEIEAHIQQSISELRTTIVRLFPPELKSRGLAEVAALQANKWCASSKINCEFQVKGERRRLGIEIERGLYRILQEALNNILKHAQATRSAVTLEYAPDSITLTVHDNGIGFTPATSQTRLTALHIGLFEMRERANMLDGKFSITSQPNQGTLVSVTIPTTLEGTVRE